MDPSRLAGDHKKAVSMYTYVHIDGLYIRLNQNPLSLFRYLWSDSRALLLHSKAQRPRVWKKLKKFILFQLRGAGSTKVITLPVFGNLCLKAHRGYKIFDFKNGVVTKLFYKDTRESDILKEIESIKLASALDFAPDVIRVDVSKRLYQERFIKGVPCIGTALPEKNGPGDPVIESVLGCLEKMVLFSRPVKMDLATYIEEISGAVASIDFSGLDDGGRKSDEITQFIESMAQRILRENIEEIDLCFSHGDFSLVNILKLRERMMVIDWESATLRSPLYDLYNYFFTEVYYGRKSRDVAVEIDEAVGALTSYLAAENPGLTASMQRIPKKIFRWLYYIERTRVLVEREPSSKLIDVVQKSLDVFSSFEDKGSRVQGTGEKA